MRDVPLSVVVDDSQLGGRPFVFGLSVLTVMDLDVSLMDVLLTRRMYSELSMTTTSDPLSGLVIMMSSRRFSWLMAC